MRLVANESNGRALLEELRAEGIAFELRQREGYEAFVGYLIEGTLEEIGKRVEELGIDAVKEGYEAFRGSLEHLLEHLREGDDVDNIISEGPWMAELLDQLYRAGALEYDGTRVRLKDGVKVEELSFEFKFPHYLAPPLEEKQFAFVDLYTEYEFEILELNIDKINALGRVASKYFPEEQLLKVYFALVARAILAGEILKALGDKKVPEEELISSFARASPIAVPTPRGTLVINYSRDYLRELLRLLKRLGYVEVKGGKVRKLRELGP